MKVGMLTSWNTQCGIAEYSKMLTKPMQYMKDIELHVLGSRNYGARAAEGNEAEGYFDVELWNNLGKKELDVERILDLELDVLHVQYEAVLYNAQRLYELLSKFKGKKVITYHDNCIPPGFRYDLFDLRYSHREDFGAFPDYILPYGIEDRISIVKTFGLGRSRDDIIADICYRNGWGFSKSFGEQTWLPHEKLYQWLRDSDIIVLYYDEAPMAGESIAARVAISTKRPVIVNKTTWFKGLSANGEIHNLWKISNEQELEDLMHSLLDNDYIHEHSWAKLAEGIVEDYGRL